MLSSLVGFFVSNIIGSCAVGRLDIGFGIFGYGSEDNEAVDSADAADAAFCRGAGFGAGVSGGGGGFGDADVCEGGFIGAGTD